MTNKSWDSFSPWKYKIFRGKTLVIPLGVFVCERMWAGRKVSRGSHMVIINVTVIRRDPLPFFQWVLDYYFPKGCKAILGCCWTLTNCETAVVRKIVRQLSEILLSITLEDNWSLPSRKNWSEKMSTGYSTHPLPSLNSSSRHRWRVKQIHHSHSGWDWTPCVQSSCSVWANNYCFATRGSILFAVPK